MTDNVCHLSLTANTIVGRDEELALVDALLARGREQGTALLLHGEPGVGKSTLAAIAVGRALGGGRNGADHDRRAVGVCSPTPPCTACCIRA